MSEGNPDSLCSDDHTIATKGGRRTPRVRIETPAGTIVTHTTIEKCDIAGCKNKAPWNCHATYYYCIKLGCNRSICDKCRSTKWMLKNKHNHRPKVCPYCEDKVSCFSISMVVIPLSIFVIVVGLLLAFIVMGKKS